MWNRIAEFAPSHWGQKSLPSLSDTGAESGSSSDWITSTERLVKENPGAALMVAFLTGATIAWWLKRR
jgi:hypothetical protein